MTSPRFVGPPTAFPIQLADRGRPALPDDQGETLFSKASNTGTGT